MTAEAGGGRPELPIEEPRSPTRPAVEVTAHFEVRPHGISHLLIEHPGLVARMIGVAEAQKLAHAMPGMHSWGVAEFIGQFARAHRVLQRWSPLGRTAH